MTSTPARACLICGEPGVLEWGFMVGTRDRGVFCGHGHLQQARRERHLMRGRRSFLPRGVVPVAERARGPLGVCIPYRERPDLVEPHRIMRESLAPGVKEGKLLVAQSDSGDPWRVSRARNSAFLKLSRHRSPPAAVLFMDADMVVEPGGLEALAEALPVAREGWWMGILVSWVCDPLWAIWDDPSEAAERVRRQILPMFRDHYSAAFWHEIDQVSRPLESMAGNVRYGPVLTNRWTFRRMGGYDERFVGWGCEDDELYERYERLSGKAPLVLRRPRFVQMSHRLDPRVGPGYDANYELYLKRGDGFSPRREFQMEGAA